MNGDIEFGGINAEEITQLLIAEPVIKNEISYVLQGLRTLSIGGYAHLPPPDIEHWFRLNTERSLSHSHSHQDTIDSNSCIFIRKIENISYQS